MKMLVKNTMGIDKYDSVFCLHPRKTFEGSPILYCGGQLSGFGNSDLEYVT